MAGEYRDLLLDHVGARRSQLHDALEYVAGTIAGPVVDPLPHVTPENWAGMRCRLGMKRCHCEHCAWEKKNRPRVDEWARAQGLRPQEKHPLPFGSLGDAVARYAQWKADGAAIESYLGPTLDRLRDQASSGVQAEVRTRADRSPRATFLASRAIDVERAILAAYQPDQVRRGVGTHACIGAFVSYHVEAKWDADAWATILAVASSVVRGIVRSGRRAAVVEMAARRMIPTPVKPATVVREIEVRREQLGGTGDE